MFYWRFHLTPLRRFSKTGQRLPIIDNIILSEYGIDRADVSAHRCRYDRQETFTEKVFGDRPQKFHLQEGVHKYPEAKAILMRSHGMFSMGPNLTVAYNLADLVEATGQIALFSSLIPE